MKRSILLGMFVLFLFVSRASAQQQLTIEDLLSAPFTENLTAAKSGNRVAWTLDKQGRRNIWVADGPEFKARQITNYTEDDGQELGQLNFSADGSTLVFVRGGEKNPAGQSPNPTNNPAGAEQAVWSVSLAGGEPKKIDAGFSPKISSHGIVAYVHDGQIWTVPLDASDKPLHIIARGQSSSPAWSPDGTKLLFTSTRGDHSFIGIYDVASKSVHFLVPSVDTDGDAVWSPDGKNVAFVRQPSETRDAPQGYFIAPDKPHPWAIWIADVATNSAHEIWHSSSAPQGSYPYMAQETGGGVIQWAGNNRLLMASEEDGWQHLYSLSIEGSTPKLLTLGNCEVEQWSLSPDGNSIAFNSNCDDIDHRHIWQVALDRGNPSRLASAASESESQWAPTFLSDSKTIVYVSAGAKEPQRIFRIDQGAMTSKAVTIGGEAWADSAHFPANRLIIPQQVIFPSANSMQIHAQLFLPKNVSPAAKHPAMIFLHGGPMRQMLLGWHYMYYYSNSYAMNQYLASRGYVVLAINYRSGIGYGRAFREAPGRAGRGATEYQDVVAAGKYLQSRADVDAKRIGLWGGSYGGFLTAMGLAHNSDMFAAGVDLHGVHDWPTDNWDGKNISPELVKLAHDSSPVTAVDTWRSPVLFIHGDDDRNVYFTQTVDLIARLREKNVELEQLIFPDEVHDFLLHRDWVAAYHAASVFLDRHLKPDAQ